MQERKYLGCFAEQYNEIHKPALAWVCQHERGSGHADFSAYDENQSYLCDIEITALFTNPAKKDPQDYEDYSPYPATPIPSELQVPGVSIRDINHPRRGFRPYARLRRVIETHLRDDYPPYWLVIYDNEHGVEHPNLEELGQLTRQVLEKKKNRGKLVSNLKQVWVFDWPSYGKTTLMRVWPSASTLRFRWRYSK